METYVWHKIKIEGQKEQQMVISLYSCGMILAQASREYSQPQAMEIGEC